MSLFPGKENHSYADLILALSLPKMLTYGVPVEMQEDLRPGMRVEVALGKNKFHAGIVARLHSEKPETFSVKPIRRIIDDTPVVYETQLGFWKWISQYYCANPGEVMQAALPAHLKLSGETKLLWSAGEEGLDHNWSDAAYLAAEALSIRKEISIPELRQIVGAKYFESVLNELLEQEVVLIDDTLAQTYRPKKEKIISLAAAFRREEALHKLFDELSRAPKQLELLMAYVELSMKNHFVKQDDLLDRTNATTSQLKALADKGVFETEEKDVSRLIPVSAEAGKEIALTAAQQTAFEKIKQGLQEKDVALLEGVQQAMLKLLEGSEVLVPPQGGRKHPEQKMVKVNTQNILFICGGAFEGIDKMIARRVQTASIGYNAIKASKELDRANLLQYVNAQDLRAFGLIPELLGRLPVVTYLNPLDESSLKRILTEPKNALIKQYTRLFEYEGVKLEVEEAALDYMVQKAVQYKLGGRGLRAICEMILTDAMFDIPSQETKQEVFHLTAEYAKQMLEHSKLEYLKAA